MHLLQLGHAQAHLLYEEHQAVLCVHLCLQLPHYVGVAVVLEVALVRVELGVAQLGGEELLQLVEVQLFLDYSLALEAVLAGVAGAAEEDLGLEVLVLLEVVHEDVIALEHAEVRDLSVQQAQLDRVDLLLREHVDHLLVLLVLVAHVALRHLLPQDLDMPLLLLARRVHRSRLLASIFLDPRPLLLHVLGMLLLEALERSLDPFERALHLPTLVGARSRLCLRVGTVPGCLIIPDGALPAGHDYYLYICYFNIRMRIYVQDVNY